MVLHFNVTGDSRRAMVRAIEKELGAKAKYLGVPSCAFQVGAYRIEKDGTLSFEDAGIEESSRVVDACVMATGVSPAEWDNNVEAEEEPHEEEKGAEQPACDAEKGAEMIDLSVCIPMEKVDLGNLIHLLDAKGELIKKALGIDNVYIREEDGVFHFDWFSKVSPDEATAYTKFIAALCEMSVKQTRISAKAKENENEKYAFRCFLLRLGFIGDEFKADRKVLLSKLEGSSAFKSGQKGGQQ